jgi:hypothetical protein
MLGYRAMFRDFFDAVERRAQPRFSLSLARRDLELLEQMQPDLRGGRPGER